LELFHRNYRAGDALMIEQRLSVPDNQDLLHAIGLDLAKLLEHNADPAAEGLAHFVYEHSPCSNCRTKAVKSLANVGCLSAWLIDECADDCSDKTRSIAADYKVSPLRTGERENREGRSNT
jgi:hypothetical protein